jgi:hypothetical protein
MNSAQNLRAKSEHSKLKELMAYIGRRLHKFTVLSISVTTKYKPA